MADPVTPTRKEIEKLVTDSSGKPNFRMVRALERLFEVAGDVTPSTLETVADLVETLAYDNLNPPQTSMVADYIDFSPNAPQGSEPGRMVWSSGSGTVNLTTSENNILQIGQKTQYRVQNNTGSTIARAKVVGINGADGAGYFRISLYSPGTSPDNANELLGVTAESIADGERGYVTSIGPIFGVDTSSWSVGTALYATSSGNLTSTRPTAPNLKVIVGYVSIQSASSGAIHVKPYLSASIDRLHDVEDGSRANGSLLIWNNSNGRYEGARMDDGEGTTIDNGAGSLQVDLNLSGGTGISISGSSTKTITNTSPFPGGASGSWTAGSGQTITASNGVITSIV